MKRHIRHFVIVIELVVSVLFVGQIVAASGGTPWKETSPIRASAHLDTENLLVNGNMEELPFYWKPPNHFVAPSWLRWWIGSGIPEYDDTRVARPHYEGGHAQVYFRWGVPYTAGIYQRVEVQPCTYYHFEMYGSNHSMPGAEHYARIGLDPQGRVYNDIDHPAISGFPSDVVWSDYQTYYKIWGRHEVLAEADGNALTAITYVSPTPGYGYYDTFWDAGSLTMAYPPDGHIPVPSSLTSDGFITSLVTETVLNYLVVEWDTAQAASTQVWYRIKPDMAPSVYTPTAYLPLVLGPSTVSPLSWNLSYADQTPVSHHEVWIGPFDDGDVVHFAALSRRLTDGSCLTSSSDLIETTVQFATPLLRSHLPIVHYR